MPVNPEIGETVTIQCNHCKAIFTQVFCNKIHLVRCPYCKTICYIGHSTPPRKENTVKKDGETITNEQGGKQSFLLADFQCIPPVVLRLLAQCLGFGKLKYGFENWKRIPQDDNLSHAMNHINEYRMGDRSEPHLVNAMARLTFALTQAVEKGDQDITYNHTDMKEVLERGPNSL